MADPEITPAAYLHDRLHMTNGLNILTLNDWCRHPPASAHPTGAVRVIEGLKANAAYQPERSTLPVRHSRAPCRKSR